jgi:hypothetical protein
LSDDQNRDRRVVEKIREPELHLKRHQDDRSRREEQEDAGGNSFAEGREPADEEKTDEEDQSTGERAQGDVDRARKAASQERARES